MTTASRPELVATCWTTSGSALPTGPVESPLHLHDRIAAASAAGFSGFGVVLADLRAYLAHHSLTELRGVLDDHGMTTVELELLEDWWVPEGPRRAASEAVHDELLRAAEALGARDVKLGPPLVGPVFDRPVRGVVDPAYDLESYAAGFHRASVAFAEVGTTVALEFLPFSTVATLSQAVELVQTAGHPNGGLLVDLWHVLRGPEGQVDELACLPVELVKGVELNDADVEPVGDLFFDTVHHRHLPGEGAWPVAQCVAHLQDIGYDGPWGVEILSDAHRARPLVESLPEVVAATRAQFDLAHDLRRNQP